MIEVELDDSVDLESAVWILLSRFCSGFWGVSAPGSIMIFRIQVPN